MTKNISFKDIYVRYCRFIDENTGFQKQEEWARKYSEKDCKNIITDLGVSFMSTPDRYINWDEEYIIYDPYKLEIELALRGY